MPTKKKRRYGLPYQGYTSSVPAHMCPPEKAWGPGNGSVSGSLNYVFSAADGSFFRRSGMANVGGTSGILEDVAGVTEVFRARHLIPVESPSMSDGYATHGVLYTDETNNLSAFYVRSTNSSGSNYQIGKEFDATNHYPGTTAATFNIKCVPYYRTTDGSFGRLATSATRAYALSGSRQARRTTYGVMFPNLNTFPMQWNMRLNESTSSGSENNRLLPAGGIPPLGYPLIAAGAVVASGDWKVGDTFFYSVAYQYSDGSVSMPMIPRPRSQYMSYGYNYVGANSLVPIANNCTYITWSQIPVGPDGVVGRWLLRTPKVNTVTSPSAAQPSPLDLMVTGYIGNNTQTTYEDTNALDLGLSSRPDIVRFDRILPPPARYISNFDGRYIVGYTKAHPAAIILSPTNPSTSGAWATTLTGLNDDSASLLTNSLEVDVGVTAANKITFNKDGVFLKEIAGINTLSIRQIVDSINDVIVGQTVWAAAVAPGADAGALGSNLQATTGCLTGDNTGHIRGFAPSLPVILPFNTTYLAGFPTQKARWFFSAGGPGIPANLDSWVAGNYRTGNASWGNLQGFAPLLDGCLIFFSKGVVLFRNIKSGKSGLDDDYHPDDLFTNLGCIAWDSIAHGQGWAGCLTDQGYMVFDGTRGGVKNISLDVYNPATGDGEWAYEIAQCQAASGADTDGAHFHAKVMGGKLYCTYRTNSSAADGVPDRMLVYDFSGSSAGTGLDQVLRPDGTPWGWSTPLSGQLSVLGEVRKSGGVQRYGAVESNLGATNGRVDRFETGAFDTALTATGITAQLWGPIDFADSLNKKQAQEVRVVHKGQTTNLALHFTRTDGITTSTGTGSGLPLPTTGASGTFSRTVVPLPQKARSPAMGNQIRLVDTGQSNDTSANATRIWGMELDEIETDAFR